MAIKLKNGKGYKCLFCSFIDPNPSKVNDHRDQEHDFVLMPITQDMLFRIMQFIFTKDEKLITEEMYEMFKMYLNNFKK